jgi:hypothetical protein
LLARYFRGAEANLLILFIKCFQQLFVHEERPMAGEINSPQSSQANENSFGEVVSFVEKHSKLLVLADAPGGASIAVWPAMQARVLTSSVAGASGRGFGWINRALIASGKLQEHINAVGGEDRIWLGPEGGQFSIFFAPGVPFDLEHWFTPAPLDTEAFDLVSQSKTSAAFRKDFSLTNFSGTKFEVRIDREVRLLSADKVWSGLGIEAVDGVRMVAYESENKLTNLSKESMKKESGLLSLWVLGQFQSTPLTTVILPFQAGPESELGIKVTTDYFGDVPEDRISIGEDSVFFKADSNWRSKLGLSPRRAKSILGSYDAQNGVLTIAQYNQQAADEMYVNSAWKIQEHPYSGDVVNTYNDGPAAPGQGQMGQFYELESSSPARELNPGETIEHTHRTIHFEGSERQLDDICQRALGVRIADIRKFNS